MRLDKPEIIAAFVALALGLVTALGYWIGSLVLDQEPTLSLALILLFGLAILSFFAVRFVLHQFIYEKVKLIYKNIHELKLGSDEEEDLIARSSDLRMVEREVSEWAEERNTEIRELKEREAFARVENSHFQYSRLHPNIDGWRTRRSQDQPQVSPACKPKCRSNDQPSARYGHAEQA